TSSIGARKSGWSMDRVPMRTSSLLSRITARASRLGARDTLRRPRGLGAVCPRIGESPRREKLDGVRGTHRCRLAVHGERRDGAERGALDQAPPLQRVVAAEAIDLVDVLDAPAALDRQVTDDELASRLVAECAGRQVLHDLLHAKRAATA